MVVVNLIGFKEFADRLKTAPAKIQNEVAHEVVEAGNDFVRRAKRDAPVDEGQLRNGISSLPINKFTVEVSSAAFHSPFIEFGTRGKYKAQEGVDASKFKGLKGNGGFYEFVLRILDWIKRKGIKAGVYSVKTHRRTGSKAQKFNEDYKLASAIAFSILKKGIKPHPFFYKQRTVVKEKFVSRIQKIISSI
jgi:HK97 gp10 family phage protein